MSTAEEQFQIDLGNSLTNLSRLAAESDPESVADVFSALGTFQANQPTVWELAAGGVEPSYEPSLQFESEGFYDFLDQGVALVEEDVALPGVVQPDESLHTGGPTDPIDFTVQTAQPGETTETIIAEIDDHVYSVFVPGGADGTGEELPGGELVVVDASVFTDEDVWGDPVDDVKEGAGDVARAFVPDGIEQLVKILPFMLVMMVMDKIGDR